MKKDTEGFREWWHAVPRDASSGRQQATQASPPEKGMPVTRETPVISGFLVVKGAYSDFYMHALRRQLEGTGIKVLSVQSTDLEFEYIPVGGQIEQG